MDETMVFLLVVFGFIAIILCSYIYMTICEKINLKKAAAGDDKERLEKAVAAVLPGEYGYQVVYAHWQESEHYGRTTKTSYYYYAIAFDPGRFWVIPLHFKGSEILAGHPVLYTQSTLGHISITTTMRKKALWLIKATLHDPYGVPLLNFLVHAANTKEDSFHPFNILQQEACNDFSQQLSSMEEQVNTSHTEVDRQLTATQEALKRKRALNSAIVALCCFFFPIISLIFGIRGLYLSPKPSQTNGKPTAPFILSIVSLIFTLCFTGFFFAFV